MPHTGSSKGKRSVFRSSTSAWVKQYLQRAETMRKLVDDNKEQLIDRNNQKHNEQTPINILCMDGGGMRGFALTAMLQELKAVGGGTGDDYFLYFDLVAGTSVGGVTALTSSYCGNVDDAYTECLTSLASTQKLLGDMSFTKLLRDGSLIAEDRLRDIFRQVVGDAPLLNPDPLHLKAFAVCAHRDKSNRKDKNPKTCWEPYLVRTYEAKVQHDAETSADCSSEFLEQGPTFLPGVSDISLAEAGMATTAVPVVFDRVSVSRNGADEQDQSVRLGDGCVISNNPVAIALLEAKSLWPGRSIGVVLSLGLIDDHEAEMNLEAVNHVQRNNPGLTYVRLVPPLESKVYMSSEKTELEARAFIRNSEDARAVMEKLRASPKRRNYTATGKPKHRRLPSLDGSEAFT